MQINGQHAPSKAKQVKPRNACRTKSAYLFNGADELLLKQLPERYAKRLLQEGTMKELSNQLQIPLGTVKSRLHRARAAFDRLAATRAKGAGATRT